MKTIWKSIGRLAGWLTWPLVGIVIRYTTRTKLLIVCDGEVLVLQSWLGTGSWSLPGGGIHYREKPESSALRELKEETGVVVKNTDLVSLGLLRQTTGHHYKFHGYMVDMPTKPVLKLRPTEIITAQWLKPNDLKNTPTQQHVQLLMDAWQKHR